MSEPKISVVIPTRARCDVLQKALLTVTSQDYDNLEIIVSDNFSGDSTEEIVRGTGDRRVRYLNTNRRVSMSHNWEFALSHILSGWVTVIGDDDGLLPGAVTKVSAIIREANVEAIRSNVCSYRWPSATGRPFGRLTVPLDSGREIRHSRKWLHKVLAGNASYVDLPMLYNGGFVSVPVLRGLRQRTGSIYRSCIPDVYSAIAIASSVESYVYSHEPLAINGASRHSTGTAHFASTRISDVSPARMFASEDNIPFHASLPLLADGRIPSSLQAMVYESFLQFHGVETDSPANMHSRQLEVILAESGGHASSIYEWGRAFARQHNLNFPAIAAKAKLRKVISRTRKMPRRALTLISTFREGSLKVPIHDVFDASVIAAKILADPPSRLGNIPRLAAETIERWL